MKGSYFVYEIITTIKEIHFVNNSIKDIEL
jgi:hypothetical protein